MMLILILAVGGGSVIDCSKIISIGAKYDGDIWSKIKNKEIEVLIRETITAGKALVNDLSNLAHRETIMFVASQALSTR